MSSSALMSCSIANFIVVFMLNLFYEQINGHRDEDIGLIVLLFVTKLCTLDDSNLNDNIVAWRIKVLDGFGIYHNTRGDILYCLSGYMPSLFMSRSVRNLWGLLYLRPHVV